MAHAPRKSPEELMEQPFWTRKDLCSVFRISIKTLNRYIYHPDQKKRLSSLKIGNTIIIDRKKALEYFRYEPFESIDI
jgi:hypothetical protein